MTRIFSTVILIISIVYSSRAQQEEKIDSLLKVYRQLEDGIPKIKTLEHLYYAEIYTDPEKGLEYAQEGLDIATRIENWSGLGVAYYHIGVYYKLTSIPDSARYYYNKSLDVWKEHPDPKLYSTVLSGLSSLESEAGNMDKAIELIKESNEITSSNGYGLKHGVGLAYLGDMYSRR